jgi:2-aminoethylphosphonate-pyruvate transaminase
VLIVVNGAYGKRAVKICNIAGRSVVAVESPEDTPPNLAEIDAILAADPGISHVFVVHCETTSGILNPLAEIADLVCRRGRGLLIDSMSAFGALPVDAREIGFDAMASSSNKCLEGVPGFAYVICRQRALERSRGNATTLVLDLHEQWRAMEATRQWRFTPPLHVIVAFNQALDEFLAEGGVAGRGRRYRQNCKILIDGMRSLGFETLLPDRLQAPIIVTFHMPRDPRFVFQTFYDRLKERGYIIYPGKLTVADSFRIGCIGRIGPEHMRAFVDTVKAVIAEMGVVDLGACRAA